MEEPEKALENSEVILGTCFLNFTIFVPVDSLFLAMSVFYAFYRCGIS